MRTKQNVEKLNFDKITELIIIRTRRKGCDRDWKLHMVEFENSLRPYQSNLLSFEMKTLLKNRSRQNLPMYPYLRLHPMEGFFPNCYVTACLPHKTKPLLPKGSVLGIYSNLYYPIDILKKIVSHIETYDLRGVLLFPEDIISN